MNVCIPVSVRPVPFIEDSSLFGCCAVSTVNISEDLNLPYHRRENPKSRVCTSVNKVIIYPYLIIQSTVPPANGSEGHNAFRT